MARLPIPNADDSTWGGILNDYLLQSHDSGGALKPDSVGSSQLQSNAVDSSSVADGSLTQSKVQNLTTDLASKADKTITITAGSGLTGGGDLSANRNVAVSFGTTSGTVTQGNDSRITGAVQSSLVDTKGDLLAGSAADTVVRVAVGTDGQVLAADSSQSSGVAWTSTNKATYPLSAYGFIAASDDK